MNTEERLAVMETYGNVDVKRFRDRHYTVYINSIRFSRDKLQRVQAIAQAYHWLNLKMFAQAVILSNFKQPGK